VKKPVIARRFLPQQSPDVVCGDCFVAKSAPRHDMT